jgi:hypothetical protein
MWFSISGGDGFVTQQDPRDPCIVYSESQGGNMGRSEHLHGRARAAAAAGLPAALPHVVRLHRAGASGSGHAAGAAGAAAPRIDRFRASQVRDSIDDTYRYNWNTPFFLSPHNPDVFYAGANRVLKSTQRGENLRSRRT